MAAISAPRRGRPIGRPTDRAAATRKPRPFLSGLCLGRRAIHLRRSLAGVAPQRLGMPPLLSDFVFFVSFVAYSSWYPIRTANQTSQLPNFQLQV